MPVGYANWLKMDSGSTHGRANEAHIVGFEKPDPSHSVIPEMDWRGLTVVCDRFDERYPQSGNLHLTIYP